MNQKNKTNIMIGVGLILWAFILFILLGIYLIDESNKSQTTSKLVDCYDSYHNLIVGAVCIDNKNVAPNYVVIGSLFAFFIILCMLSYGVRYIYENLQ